VPTPDCTVIVSQPFAENTYLARLGDSTACLVFDPGLEPEKIVRHLADSGLTPAAILCTHGHSDHIAGNAVMKEGWPEAPLVIGHGDAPMLADADLNLSAGFGFPITSPPADRTLRENETFEAAGWRLRVLEIPGHSPGHIVYVWEAGSPAYVFGGDVLFRGSIGRTDFPGGSFEQLVRGIHDKLFTMPPETVILPGHGPRTTVGEEIAGNPFVGRPAGYQP